MSLFKYFSKPRKRARDSFTQLELSETIQLTLITPKCHLHYRMLSNASDTLCKRSTERPLSPSLTAVPSFFLLALLQRLHNKPPHESRPSPLLNSPPTPPSKQCKLAILECLFQREIMVEVLKMLTSTILLLITWHQILLMSF